MERLIKPNKFRQYLGFQPVGKVEVIVENDSRMGKFNLIFIKIRVYT